MQVLLPSKFLRCYIFINGIQSIFKGSASVESLRGGSKYVAEAIAMPIFIGPGMVSYSVIIGEQLDIMSSVLAIAISLILCISIIFLLKILHDNIHAKKRRVN